MVEDELLYVGQKAFIEKEGQILILQAEDGLDFPGGKIQEGETQSPESLIASLKREIREETNLEVDVYEPFFVWPFKSTKYLGKTIYLVGFKCKYVSGEVKISHEHSGFEWVDKNDFRKFEDGSDYFKALEKYFTET